MLDAATERLAAAVDEVNALNVYPVPDGDTGTNMLHTMKSALQHARGAERTLPALLAGAAHGALMGARGNSGVILSQILKGLKDSTVDDGLDLPRAFALARTYAYAAVTQPAPGTILTALSEISESVQAQASGPAGPAGPGELLGVAVRVGTAAVQRTRSENPVNRSAGVVDAGARGFWLLLDGALAALEGRVTPTGPLEPSATGGVTTVARDDLPASWAGAYDVQCLITMPSRPIDEIRTAMLEFGADCVLVVGDETVCKIHVHTQAPHEILRIAIAAGRISDVVIEDLELMSAEHEAATGIVVANTAEAAAVGVVAVVGGDGLARIAASLGAQVIAGGATMNPSTQQLLDGIARANARHVVVLPNDKNVILAAEQAAALAAGVVTVLPTRNIAQGMAALAAFDGRSPADLSVAAMRRAADGTRAIEITQAVRDATVDGATVSRGEHLALVDGKLVGHGADEAATLGAAASALAGAGLLTVYVGAEVDAGRRDAAVAVLRTACPDAEVEVVDGGQPHYPFVVAVE